MKKSLIAVAVLGAAASASAQVTLSGRASMEVGSWGTSGSTPTATKSAADLDFKSRTRVVDTGSRITFAVNESLGGGLNAKVYCETGLNIDNGSNTGQAGTINANTSEWCSREGHLAIGNAMIEARLGRQNVWWTQGALNNIGATYLGGDAGTDLINGGVGVYGVRLENMIKIVAGPAAKAFAGSEIYMGFMGNGGAQGSGANLTAPTTPTGTLQYSQVYPLAQNGLNNTVAGEHAGAGLSSKADYQGFKLNYSQGALVGMVDGQMSDRGGVNDAVPGQGYNKRTAYKLGGGYRYSGTKSPNIVSVQYWTKEATTANGATKAEDTGFSLLGQYSLGSGMILHGQWTKANAVKKNGVTDAGTGATSFIVGITKSLSNRTHILAHYRVIDNDRNGLYGFGGGSYQSGTPAAGATSKAFGIGAIHNF